MIALKFGAQKGGVRAYLGTKFGWNTITLSKLFVIIFLALLKWASD